MASAEVVKITLDTLSTTLEVIEQELLRLETENKLLRDALQELYDEQNGPPLIRDKDGWQAAMSKAEQALKEK